MQSDRLFKLASLFEKQAELREDMVKRIFLSVLPAVSSKTEMHWTGGQPSFQLLKSAAQGAFDLVKYGTAACVKELHYYDGVGTKRYGEEYLNEHYKSQGITPPHSSFNTKTIYDVAQMYLNQANKQESGSLGAIGMYERALGVCLDGFNDLPAWPESYGGRAWAKIAETLDQINMNCGHIIKARQQGLLDQEVATMREQIVLMNVFDGLAHNTANVMGKVVGEEKVDRLGAVQSNRSLTEKQRSRMMLLLNEYYSDTTKSMERLMDAKELSNPMQVYQIIAPEMEKLPSRSLFKEWMGKIHRHPEYRTAPDYTKALIVIRTKKMCITYIKTWEPMMSELEASKDALNNSILQKFQLQVIEGFKTVAGKLAANVCELKYRIEDERNRLKKQHSDNDEEPDIDILNQLWSLYNELDGMYQVLHDIHYRGFVSSVDATNVFHTVKSFVARITAGAQELA
jgi:hypothetical protein